MGTEEGNTRLQYLTILNLYYLTRPLTQSCEVFIFYLEKISGENYQYIDCIFCGGVIVLPLVKKTTDYSFYLLDSLRNYKMLHIGHPNGLYSHDSYVK